MTEFLEKIRWAWKTSKRYKRRVSILLMSNDRNYTLELLCRACNKHEELKEAEIYHISALGQKKLKESKKTVADIPANAYDKETKIDEGVSIIQEACKDAKSSRIIIVDDFLTHLDDRKPADLPVGINRQLFLDLFEKTLDADCTAQVFIFLEHSEKRELIPDIVDAEIQIVEHTYPTRDEVRDIAQREVNAYKTRSGKTIEEEKKLIEGFSAHLSGFAFSTISWVVREAFVRHEEKGNLTPDLCTQIIDTVKLQKETLIGQQLGMNILKSTEDKPIGVEKFLAYVEKRKNRICIPGQDRLKGVLFIGPPGTGKSMLAKYMSSDLNIPAIEVRVSSLMSQWLGETENLFRRLTDMLDAMAPVIVYIDEIEKMFSQDSGHGGGASMIRATGHILTWMNDTTAPIFIIATANNVERMGEIGLTMIRRGRLDALFYIGCPDLESRKELFKYYAGKARLKLNDDNLQELAKTTKFFTGADIYGVVQDTNSEASDPANSYTHFIEAVTAHKPRVDAMKQMYGASTGGVMRKLAIPAGNFESEEN